MADLNWFNFLTFTTVSYIACSFFFLKYPNLIHKRKTYKNKILQMTVNSNKILHISHRGGCSESLIINS